MSHSNLRGVKAKIERTKSQVGELNRIVSDFLRHSTYKVASKHDPEQDEAIWSFQLAEEVPEAIAVVVGEILHNLRSALDSLACAIALQHSKSSKGTYFPFGADASIFETELTRKGKKLPADAVDIIRALKPFKGGNDLLWTVHNLNRRDKHIELTPINLRSSSNSASYLTVWSGMALVIGSRAGQHLVVARRTPAEIAAMGSPTGVYSVGPGLAIEFGTDGCTPDQSREFLTTTPEAKFETNMKPSFNIALSDVEGLELEPVVAVMHKMRQLVEGILLTFEKRFF